MGGELSNEYLIKGGNEYLIKGVHTGTVDTVEMLAAQGLAWGDGQFVIHSDIHDDDNLAVWSRQAGKILYARWPGRVPAQVSTTDRIYRYLRALTDEELANLSFVNSERLLTRATRLLYAERGATFRGPELPRPGRLKAEAEIAEAARKEAAELERKAKIKATPARPTYGYSTEALAYAVVGAERDALAARQYAEIARRQVGALSDRVAKLEQAAKPVVQVTYTEHQVRKAMAYAGIGLHERHTVVDQLKKQH